MNDTGAKLMIGIGVALMALAPIIYFLIFHDEIMRVLGTNQAFRAFGGGGMDVIIMMRGIQLVHAAVFLIGGALTFFGWRKLNAVA